MSSCSTASKSVRGRQEPRIRHVPDYVYSDGEDAGTLSKSYGLPPDPWQQDILDSWLGRDDEDRYTASRCGCLVARQNGKNGVLEMRELYGLAILGERILHTAHEVKTARKAFLRLASFFENEREYPELASLVVAIRRTNGQEAITLTNGGSIEFSARSRGAARGFTVDVVVCDEAQELNEEQLEALMPTMSATDNPQLILVGTPPNSDSIGDVFGRMRKSGIEGNDKKLSWHEWSIESLEVDISDPDVWAQCNPALGYRLNISTIEDEYAQLSTDGFARERLSFWLDAAKENRPIDKEKWEACATDKRPSDEIKLAYGVKFSADGAWCSLSVASKQEDGTIHCEVIEHRSMSSGLGWLVEWLVPRLKKASTVAIDGLHWQGSLVENLRGAGVRNKLAITVPGTKDVVTAASMFIDALAENKVTHCNQEALNESALSAEKRMIGDKGGWGFGGDVDTTLIESVTLAHWAVITCRRNPKRQQKLL